MKTTLSSMLVRITVALAAGVFVSPVLHAQASFIHLPSDVSYAWGVADDGTVVGEGATRGFRWKQGAGLTFLDPLPGHTNTTAFAVARDGSAVAGVSLGGSPAQAVRWNAAGTPSAIDLPAGATSAQAWGLSDNGAVATGEVLVGGSLRALRWTQADGGAALDPLPGAPTSHGFDASDTGAVVGVSGGQAFRWTEAGGMAGLGFVAGATSSFGTAVSADGTVVTGFSGVGGSQQPFRWTEADGMVGLGLLPGTIYAFGHAITADGGTIIGETSYPSDMVGGGFIWTEEDGMRSFVDVLTNDYGLGADVAGLTEIVPRAISANGRYIAGMATTGAWLFDRGPGDFQPVPEPSTYGALGAALLVALVVRRRWSRRRVSAGGTAPADRQRFDRG